MTPPTPRRTSTARTTPTASTPTPVPPTATPTRPTRSAGDAGDTGDPANRGTAADKAVDPGRAALGRCVDDPDGFLTTTFGAAPCLRRGGGSFDDLLSLDDVDRALTGSGLRQPAFRLVRDGEPIDPSSYTRPARTGNRRFSDLIDPGRVLDLFAGGATVVLQSLHRWWPPLARLCRDLELALGHQLQVNAYLTPAGAAPPSPVRRRAGRRATGAVRDRPRAGRRALPAPRRRPLGGSPGRHVAAPDAGRAGHHRARRAAPGDRPGRRRGRLPHQPAGRLPVRAGHGGTSGQDRGGRPHRLARAARPRRRGRRDERAVLRPAHAFARGPARRAGGARPDRRRHRRATPRRRRRRAPACGRRRAAARPRRPAGDPAPRAPARRGAPARPR